MNTQNKIEEQKENVIERQNVIHDRLILDNSPQGLRLSIFNHLRYSLARDFQTASKRDWWVATCGAVRDRILERYMCTMAYHDEVNTRRVYYLSLEYLMGRLLNENINNMRINGAVRQALQELGLQYEQLEEQEPDMGLGNGGLGRLAACFLDSLASLEYPAIGYGIHYEFGLFTQEIKDSKQVEHPDNWLKFGHPWQIQRPENSIEVHLYGRVEMEHNDRGEQISKWVNTQTIIGVPWDVPIIGYNVETVNFLRLWESIASNEFDYKVFDEGGYIDAVRDKVVGETISKVLYPNDKTESGKELRLVQQYFFVACSLRDMMYRHKLRNPNWDNFAEKVAIQLNDTHPTIAIAELMRVFLDEEGLAWEKAWSICQKVFSYTNHTLLPEALESWSVAMLEKVLPRHLMIIYEINFRFLNGEVEAKWPGDVDKKRHLSIIDEGYGYKMVRMAYLAVIGSHTVNGVAELHTQLLRKKLFPDFCELYPNKFINITNGVAPRRWICSSNPQLARLMTSAIGERWPSHLEELGQLEKFQDDISFLDEISKIKLSNKVNLSNLIKKLCNIEVDPYALFDVQIKRIHEYKRQHLNLLHIITLYHRLLHNPSLDISPRVFIFSGKAAPGYAIAKNIIYAINRVGEVINNDKRIGDRLKVVFLPNYSVTLASEIIPAADLSEQISTAGKEASGTGNMKLALNGALTIGTLDGANVEIRNKAGEENIFIFGMTVEQVQRLCDEGYNPYHYYNSNSELSTMLDWLGSGYFSEGDSSAFMPLKQSLLEGGDRFMVLADFKSYCDKQQEVDNAFKQKTIWAKKSLLNIARMGYFSGDRAIQEYADKIWKIKPLPATCLLQR